MRILLSPESKKRLFILLQKHFKTTDRKELAGHLGTCESTFGKWISDPSRYIPNNRIPDSLLRQLTIVDTKPEHWGQIKGGKRTYQIILTKYGLEEITRRRRKGALNGALARDHMLQESTHVDLFNPLFLELYGALLGDGWLSKLTYNNKTLWWIGLCGHAVLDKEHLLAKKAIFEEMFGKKVTVKYKKGTNGMELILSHKHLLLYLNQELGFPIGTKKDLLIYPPLAEDWQRLIPILRGIFDTDGCFYFDKTPANKQYPCISITMFAPRLLSQIYKQLIAHGYKATLQPTRITLKGSIQVNRWMLEIGSSNPKHLNKYCPRGATDSAAAS